MTWIHVRQIRIIVLPPDKAQQNWVHVLLDTLYTNKPPGLYWLTYFWSIYQFYVPAVMCQAPFV